MSTSDDKTNSSQTVSLTEAAMNVDIFSQGDRLYWKGEYQNAKEHFQGLLKQATMTLIELARCLNSLGAVNAKLKCYHEALDNYSQRILVLSDLDTPDRQENIARCYLSMSIIYELEEQYDEALDKNKEAFAALANTKPDSNIVTEVYQNMANLYTKKRDFASAVMYFEKKLHLDCQLLRENHPAVGQTYANIGTMYYIKQDYHQALDYLKKAREMWLKLLRPSHVHIQSIERKILNVQKKLDASNRETLPSKNDSNVCKDTKENYSDPEKTDYTSLARYFSLIPPTIEQQEVQSDSGLDSDRESISDVSSQSDVTEDEENLEYYTLVWFDVNVNSIEENRRTQIELRKIVNFLKAFETSDECKAYIERSIDGKIILIVSENLGRDLVSEIHHLGQIVAIYVYCADKKEHRKWPSDYDKVKGIVLTTTDLVEHIAKDQKKRNKVREEELSISIMKPSFASLHNTGSSVYRSPSFMLTSLFIDTLLKMELHSRETIYDDFINLYRYHYANNHIALATLSDFKHNYNPENAVQWYTRGSFLYRILNRALRTEDISVLYTLRFFIIDLIYQLTQEQMRQKDLEGSSIIVYRGARMSTEELEALSANTVVSVNSFFSTSRDMDLASAFIGMSHNSNQSNAPVVFEIQARFQPDTSRPFADISHLNNFSHEREVLFSPGSVFKVTGVTEDIERRIWKINLELVDNEADELDLVAKVLKTESAEKKPVLYMRNLLREMGKINEAERYYKQLLNSLKGNDPRISQCYSNLGTIRREKADYEGAYFFHQKALELDSRLPSLDQVVIAKDYMNIGLVSKDKGDYDQALEYLTRALNLFLNTVAGDNLTIASVYHNIGLVYVELCEYNLAVLNFYKSLNIETRLLSPNHPEIAAILNNIGVVYYLTKDYGLALENFKKALCIQTDNTEKYSDIANTRINMGLVYATGFKNYHEAISQFEMALEIFNSNLPVNYPSMIRTKNIITKTKQILNDKE